MHSEALSNYVRRLCEVIDGATHSRDSSKKIDRPRTDGSKSFTLNDDVEEKLRNIAADLLKREKWNEKFSESYLRNCLSDEIVAKNIGTKDNSEVLGDFSKLVSRYESHDVEYAVLIPVFGLYLALPSLNLGPITFFPAGSAYFKTLNQRAGLIVAATLHPEGRKKDILSFLGKTILEFESVVCAECRIKAEPNRAVERAYEDTRLAIDILQFAAGLLTPSIRKTRVALRDEVQRDVRRAMAICDDNIITNEGLVDSFDPFCIDVKILHEMTKLGMFELAKAIESKAQFPNPSFIESILRAIYWYSNAQRQIELPNQLLGYVTSIECFFETRDRPISSTISDSLALIFGDTFEQRQRVKDVVSEFYSIRSRISHGGHSPIAGSHVTKAWDLCSEMIAWAISCRTRFKDREHLASWIEGIKFGRSNDATLLPEIAGSA